MPAVTATRHTWTVTVQREEGDSWPDLADSDARTLRLTPETLHITYARTDRRWQFESMTVNGTRFYPAARGEKKTRGMGRVVYTAGGVPVPPEFHALISAEEAVAGLEESEVAT
jgi:hypothetical protein